MVSFSKLWDSHPGADIRPCDRTTFKNQCSIRMGVALEGAGVDLKSFRGARCWIKGHNSKHILRAQELADWISGRIVSFGTKERIIRREMPALSMVNYIGKQGIVFIQDGWNSTDHIDLWDGINMKAGRSNYFSLGTEIWFWKL